MNNHPYKNIQILLDINMLGNGTEIGEFILQFLL